MRRLSDEELRRRLVAERPARIERIHPSWIAGAPPPADVPDDVRRWIERGRHASLVDMPAGEASSLESPEDLARIPVEDLRRLIELVGRKQLALVAQAAPQGAARLIAAQLGAQAGAFLADVATKAPRGEISLAVRRLAAASRKPPILFRAGAAFLAPWLAARELDRVVAQRLPRELGVLLVGADADDTDMWAQIVLLSRQT